MHFLLLVYGMKQTTLFQGILLITIDIFIMTNILIRLPKGKGHAAFSTSQLPGLFKTIFKDEVLK